MRVGDEKFSKTAWDKGKAQMGSCDKEGAGEKAGLKNEEINRNPSSDLGIIDNSPEQESYSQHTSLRVEWGSLSILDTETYIMLENGNLNLMIDLTFLYKKY